jgi:hypothetical protein
MMQLHHGHLPTSAAYRYSPVMYSARYIISITHHLMSHDTIQGPAYITSASYKTSLDYHVNCGAYRLHCTRGCSSIVDHDGYIPRKRRDRIL